MLAAVTPPAGALPPGDTGAATEPVSGITRDGAFLDATFVPGHFGVDPNGNLVAAGRVTGVINRSGALPTHVDEQITLPVDRQATTGSCPMADVAVGPEDVTLGGTALHMDQAIVNISMAQGPGSRLQVPLCRAGELMKGPPAQTNPGLSDLLNQMLRLLGQGG